ncbi:MAG TPA: multidrug ABC transporter substrate-binding protein, partial [Prevotellaceae bacterium]|nr:multidrug ABC transporter substrate-binding protein [Prevotellaceae bacterium]
GIMNIMLVSVTERTKEIGLRMSVGARGVDILSQFLIESIMISLTGAILGVALGYGGSWVASTFFGLPSSVPFWSVGVSFCVCAFIGVFFGYVPARKAARMDPIEAIRYE